MLDAKKAGESEPPDKKKGGKEVWDKRKRRDNDLNKNNGSSKFTTWCSAYYAVRHIKKRERPQDIKENLTYLRKLGTNEKKKDENHKNIPWDQLITQITNL